MRKLAVALITICLISLTGCQGGDAFSPPVPSLLAAPPVTTKAGQAKSETLDQTLGRLVDSYYADTATPDEKKQIRNQITDRLLGAIDASFRSFDEGLYRNRSLSDFTFDLINLGLGFAGTITPGATPKTLLAAIVTLTTGSKLAVDTDLYNKQTTLAISAKMKALRSATAVVIAGHRDDSADKYPLYPNAIRDAAEYYRDGTVLGALEGISATASVDSTTNKDNLSQIESGAMMSVLRTAPGRTLLRPKRPIAPPAPNVPPG